VNIQKHSETSVNLLKGQLQSMSQIVKRAIDRSTESLLTFDAEMAKDVIGEDKTINGFEIAIDNATFDILSINDGNLSPDSLRTILSIQKINPMLERIGDHAVNIAESAETISGQSKHCDLLEIPLMIELCKSIFHDAVKSFFARDLLLAEKVLRGDDSVDRLNVSIASEIKAGILTDCNSLCDLPFEVAAEIMRISRNLERIADLSTNIAEETFFSTIGKIVKHNKQQKIIN
jgi:phosphate transport system protein